MSARKQSYQELKKNHGLNNIEFEYIQAELEYGFAASGSSMDYGLAQERGEAINLAKKHLSPERLEELDCIVADVLQPDHQRPVCDECLIPDAFDWYVPDKVWTAVVPEYLQNSILCLKCFDNLASIKNINYTIDILHFFGRQMAFIFHCSSRVDRHGRG